LTQIILKIYLVNCVIKKIVLQSYQTELDFTHRQGMDCSLPGIGGESGIHIYFSPCLHELEGDLYLGGFIGKHSHFEGGGRPLINIGLPAAHLCIYPDLHAAFEDSGARFLRQ